ncbi:hypothetical protein N0V86_009239 [Didymella sp. IMI 355093]|nr:hypothetical protein N0V86_009239 [Didymella sp. IMI 355093]
MPVILYRAILAIAYLFALTRAQCQNNLAIWNPGLRTQSGNNVWFLVPVSKEKAMNALNEAFPTNKVTGDLTLLNISSIPGVPEGLVSENQHLVLIAHGAIGDTRQSILQLGDDLLAAQTMVTFVSYKRSSRPMIAPLNGYIGGKKKDEILNKLRLIGLVPALVSSLLEGIALRLGVFLPENEAWQCNSDGECSANSKWQLLGNPLSGPGAIVEAVDITFRNTTSSTLV